MKRTVPASLALGLIAAAFGGAAGASGATDPPTVSQWSYPRHAGSRRLTVVHPDIRSLSVSLAVLAAVQPVKPAAGAASATGTAVPAPSRAPSQPKVGAIDASAAYFAARSPAGIQLAVEAPQPPAGIRADQLPAWRRLTSTAQAKWLVGGTPGEVNAAVTKYVDGAASRLTLPVLAPYSLPNRDCGSYSGGGAADADAYAAWTSAVAGAIAGRPAIIILESDALASWDCLAAAVRDERIAMLSAAIRTYSSPHAFIYLDAGHPAWLAADEAASRLRAVGLSALTGFSLNVSNFRSDAEAEEYGSRVSALTGGLHYVVDSSRNGGAVADGAWCNPAGWKPGRAPTTTTGSPLLDGYLWIKHPGESDGTCAGGPPAGSWIGLP